MVTIEQNRDHFDPVTRAYLCRLHLDEPKVVQQAVRLRVTFLSAQGRRLEAEVVLREDDEGLPLS